VRARQFLLGTAMITSQRRAAALTLGALRDPRSLDEAGGS